MNRKLLFALLALLSVTVQAQVGIGTELPNNSTQLDIVSEDSGVLFPRISLTSSTDTSTISNGNVTSLFIYNVATANDVIPGYYYWDGLRWRRLINENDATLFETLTNLVDNGDGTITYTNEDGTNQTIDIAAIVAANETVTTLVQADGTYTYTSEDGITTTFNVTQTGNGDPSGNGTVGAAGDIYVDEATGDIYTFDGTTWVLSGGPSFETVTVLVDNGDGSITYTDEDGNDTTINLATIIDNFETVTNLVDNGNGTITYTNEDGTNQTIDIAAIVAANETVTTLVQADGTYTYTSEDGTTTTFNVTQTGNGDPNGNGTVGAAGDIYVDEATGDIYTFDGTTWVLSGGPNFETLTSLTDNGDGTITYVDEDGVATILNIAVIGGTETLTNLVDNGNGTITYTNEDGTDQTVDIAAIVAANETVTTLVQADGTYTYTSEDGTTTTFNVTQTGNGDPNGNGTVGAAGDIYVDEATGDIYTFDGTTWVLSGGPNFETVTVLVDNGDGSITYTDEDGNDTTINLATIIDNFETVTNLVDNGNGTITYTNEEGTDQTVDIAAIVAANETVTTLVQADGTYTYTSEDGTTTTFNVTQTGNGDPSGNGTVGAAGDIYVDEATGDIYTFDGTTWVLSGGPNFETLTSLTDNGDGTITYVDEDGVATILNIAVIGGTETVTNLVDNGNGTITYTNEDGTDQTVDIAAIVAANETVTTLVQADGTYTYTSEDGTTTTFNVSQTGTGDPNGNGTVGTAGDIYVDEATGDIYTFDGTTWVISGGPNFETLTSLTDNGDGTITYVDEDGVATILNIAVIGGTETVTNLADNGDGTITYTNEEGTDQTVDIATIVDENETLTTISNDATAGTITYMDEDGTLNTIDVEGLAANISVLDAANNFTATDVEGVLAELFAAIATGGDGVINGASVTGTTLTITRTVGAPIFC